MGTTPFLVFIFKEGCLRGGMAEVVRAGEGFSRLVGPQAQAVKLSGRWQNLCQHGLDPEADTPTSAKTLCSHPWPPPSRSPRVRVHQWPDSRAKPCRSAAGSPLRRGPQAGRCALCLTSCGLGAAGTEDHTQLSNDSFCVCLSAPLSSSFPTRRQCWGWAWIPISCALCTLGGRDLLFSRWKG